MTINARLNALVQANVTACDNCLKDLQSLDGGVDNLYQDIIAKFGTNEEKNISVHVFEQRKALAQPLIGKNQALLERKTALVSKHLISSDLLESQKAELREIVNKINLVIEWNECMLGYLINGKRFPAELQITVAGQKSSLTPDVSKRLFEKVSKAMKNIQINNKELNIAIDEGFRALRREFDRFTPLMIRNASKDKYRVFLTQIKKFETVNTSLNTAVQKTTRLTSNQKPFFAEQFADICRCIQITRIEIHKNNEALQGLRENLTNIPDFKALNPVQLDFDNTAKNDKKQISDLLNQKTLEETFESLKKEVPGLANELVNDGKKSEKKTTSSLEDDSEYCVQVQNNRELAEIESRMTQVKQIEEIIAILTTEQSSLVDDIESDATPIVRVEAQGQGKPPAAASVPSSKSPASNDSNCSLM